MDMTRIVTMVTKPASRFFLLPSPVWWRTCKAIFFLFNSWDIHFVDERIPRFSWFTYWYYWLFVPSCRQDRWKEILQIYCFSLHCLMHQQYFISDLVLNILFVKRSPPRITKNIQYCFFCWSLHWLNTLSPFTYALCLLSVSFKQAEESPYCCYHLLRILWRPFHETKPIIFFCSA